MISPLPLHYMKFDRPHIYTCTCGGHLMIFVGKKGATEKIMKEPKSLTPLSCGHAPCAFENDRCVLCLNGHSLPVIEE